jgi:hypothetical protein
VDKLTLYGWGEAVRSTCVKINSKFIRVCEGYHIRVGVTYCPYCKHHFPAGVLCSSLSSFVGNVFGLHGIGQSTLVFFHSQANDVSKALIWSVYCTFVCLRDE